MKPDLWMDRQKISHRLSLVCRQIIEHNVDLFGPSGLVYQSGEKVDELSTGVPLRGLALYLARLDIQRSI